MADLPGQTILSPESLFPTLIWVGALVLFLVPATRVAGAWTLLVWAGINLAIIIGDLILAKILFGAALEAAGKELIDSETTQAILRAIVLIAIWVPYMLNSRRVRNTFVR